MNGLETIKRLNAEAEKRALDINKWFTSTLIAHAREFIRRAGVTNSDCGQSFVAGYLHGQGLDETVAHNITEEAFK